MKTFSLTIWVALAAIAALGTPARALFEVKDPLSKMYGSGSRAVIAGTITGLNPENHVLTVKPTAVYKGPAIEGEALQIQLAAPESLRQEVKVGAPVVIFQGVRSIAVHVADHWYGGEPLTKPNQFRINAALGHAAHTSHDETFPGKTGALVRAVEELKAEKSSLLNVVPDKLFPAPVKAGFTLPANAAALAVVQTGDARTPTFVVAMAAAGGVHAFTLKGQSVDDTTASLGLAGLKASLVAGTTVEGKPSLLLDTDLFTFAGGVFKKTTALEFTGEKNFGIVIDDFNDDGKPAIIGVTAKGLFRLPLAEAHPGAKAAADDDTRLTGAKLTEYHRAHNGGFTSATVAAVDLNGDKRPDLVLLTPEGTLTLLNRGFGGYLVNKDMAAPLLDVAGTGKPALPLIAGAAGALWLLEKDGTVYRYDFPAK